MNRFRFLLATMLTMSIANAMYSITCVPKDELSAYLTDQHTAPRQVLAFDHLKQQWIGYQWDGATLTEDAHLVERKVSDRPRMLFRPNVPILVVVTDTNPIVFRVAQTEATQVNSAELESIKTFLAAAGGFTTTAVTTVAQASIARRTPAPSAASSIADPTQSGATANNLPSDVETLANALATSSEATATKATRLQATLKELKKLIDSTQRDVNDLATFGQLVERGITDVARPASSADVPQKLSVAMDDVASALGGVPDLPCADVVDSLGALVRIKLEGFSSDPLLAGRARRDYADALDHLLAPACDDEALREAVARLARWLQANPPSIRPDSMETTDLLIADRQIRKYVQLGAKAGTLAKGATDLLAKRNEVIVSAAGLAFAVERMNAAPKDRPCSLIAGVLEVPRAQQSDVDLLLGQEGNETFKITADAPYEKLSLRHGNALEKKFALHRRSWIDPDVDVALTYTRLADPTFATVVDPNNSMGKIVKRTKETTRAGQLAVMLTGRFRDPVTSVISPQIGFLVSAGNPGAFVGLALQLGPYVKLSGGSTWQKVTKLARGFTEGQPLPANESDVRTRDGFGHRGYLALSVTLDNLSLFKQ